MTGVHCVTGTRTTPLRPSDVETTMSPEPADDPLFDEFRLNRLDLENRIGLSPMTRVSATETGEATDEMAEYYAKFARGGFSFLITEGTYPDDEHGQGYPDQPGLATDEQADAWGKVTDAVHEEGAPILAQLMHAGPLVQGNRFVDTPIGPSEIPPKGDPLPAYGGDTGEYATPRKMTHEDIADVTESFVEAARRAEDAGFSGVEIHGANGYLLDAFLTEYANDRDDEYGGSPENRVRFPAEVVAAVREALDEEFVVGIRLSQSKVNDPDYRWPGEEAEAETIFTTLCEAGVDYLHVTEADITAPAFGSGPTLSELAARHGDVPVIANGGLSDPEAARETIETGGADLITLATGALANPDWPKRVAKGDALDAFDPEETLQPDASINGFEVPE